MLSFNRCFFVGFVVCSLMGFGSTPTFAWVDIAYYRFEEGTAGSAASGNGTILDSSGNGLNGTAMNRNTYDDSSGFIRFYMNRALGAEAVNIIRPLGILDSSYSPGIGIGNVQSPNYGQYFPGLIDDVRISDHALRPDQFLSDFVVPEPSISFCIGIRMFLLHALKIRKRKIMFSFGKLILARRLIVQSLLVLLCMVCFKKSNVLAVDYLYVATGSGNIKQFDSDFNLIKTFGLPYNGPGENSIGIDSSGVLYFGSSWTHSVLNKFDTNGNFISTITSRGWPSGLAINSRNFLYQSEDTGSTIEVYDSSGQYYQTISSPELNKPQGIVFDSQDNLYVANMDNSNILKFNAAGQFVSKITTNLDHPRDVAIDKDGNLYVANWSINTVSKFDASGNYLFSIGGPSGLNGAQFSITTDTSGYIYVGTWDQIFKYDSNGLLITKSISLNGSDMYGRMVVHSVPFSVPEPSTIILTLIGLGVFTLSYLKKKQTRSPSRKHYLAMKNVMLLVIMSSGNHVFAWADIVYGTGVLNDGVSAPVSAVDLHYKIIATSDYYTSQTIPLESTDAYVWPLTGFVQSGDSSQWISLSEITNGFPIGWYTFRTTFDLTGYDPNTFSISGNWAMDNCTIGPAMLLNGVDTGNELFSNEDSERFRQLYPFTITSGFQTGLNTLDFVVFNWGGPTALLVSMQSSAAYSVPETSSVMMAAIGLLLITAMAMKRLYVPSGHMTDVCTT